MDIEALNKMIAPTVTALGFEFVACEYSAASHRATVRVYIDKEGGVNIDDCSFVSRQLGAVLDVENIIAGRYDLEVSSPGFDRLLVTLHHYRRFLGQRAKIRLKQADIAGRRSFTGVLSAVEGEGIVINVDGQQVNLKLADIEKANLAPEIVVPVKKKNKRK